MRGRNPIGLVNCNLPQFVVLLLSFFRWNFGREAFCELVRIVPRVPGREKSSTEFGTGGRKFVLLDVWPPASMFPSLDFGF